MALSTCTISGTLKALDGTPLSGVAVEAYNMSTFFYGDGTMIPPYHVSTTTDATGAWSLTLCETTSILKTVTISFQLPTSSVQLLRKDYEITVPNTATASFSTLASGQ